MSDSTRATGTTTASAGGVALAILCAQQFNMSYDTVGMNVALSTIVEDLGTTLTGMQTAIAMYSLVMAAFVVTGVKLADRWGRRVFLLEALTYGTGAGIAALSPTLAVMTCQLRWGGPHSGVRRHRRRAVLGAAIWDRCAK